MTNADIAAAFEHVADLLDYQGENVFRVRAYRTAARTIDGLVESLASVRADATRSLTDLDGIGVDLARKIETLLDTGRLPLLEELERKVPAVVFDLMRVPGLGPKKIKALVDGLGIDSLPALEAACREGRVRGIKGFGRVTGTAPEFVKAEVARNGEQPGGELRRRLVACGGLPDLHEDALREVLRLGRVGQRTIDEVQHRLQHLHVSK